MVRWMMVAACLAACSVAMAQEGEGTKDGQQAQAPQAQPAAAAKAAPQASAHLKLDSWRWEIGAGANLSSGNTESSSVNLDLNGERPSVDGKWTLTGRVLYARDEGSTSADRLAVGLSHAHDLTPEWFFLSQVDGLRDRPANLASRWTVGTGGGYHLIKEDESMWDVMAGVGYSEDRYLRRNEVDGEQRDALGRAELFLGTEWNRRLTATTTARQKLTARPPMGGAGGLRAEWTAGLAVSISATLKLNTNLSVRYDSEPGAGLKRTDTSLVTGVSMTID